MTRNVFIAVILTAIVAVGGTYYWRQGANDQYLQDAIGEVVSAYQNEIDSLNSQVQLLQSNRYSRLQSRPGDNGPKDSLFDGMTTEIDFLRKRLKRVMRQTIIAAGADPIKVYISKLADSGFVSHYGNYVKPSTWTLAAEELGSFGKAAIPSLIKRLDTKSEYEKEQVLYALMLAAQHSDVLGFTEGDNPADRRRTEYQMMTKTEAWKKWFLKYKGELE